MTPDIEIYLKRIPASDIMLWLERYFDIVEKSRHADTTSLDLLYEGQSLKCVIVEKAVKGGYTSVWFKDNLTPWQDDEACAVDAFSHFNAETRCSTGGWQDGDDNPLQEKGGWYRFTEKGKTVVNWLA